MPNESVADVLYRVQQVNQHIGSVLLQLLNDPDPARQAAWLRDLGKQFGTLSAECLSQAAQRDGRCGDPPQRIIIDASDRPAHW